MLQWKHQDGGDARNLRYLSWNAALCGTDSSRKRLQATASRKGKSGLFKSFEGIMIVSNHYIEDTKLMNSAFAMMDIGFS